MWAYYIEQLLNTTLLPHIVNRPDFSDILKYKFVFDCDPHSCGFDTSGVLKLKIIVILLLLFSYCICLHDYPSI